MTEKFIYHPDFTQAGPEDIFVFGSNLAGFHGAGAALAAYNYYGAQLGIGEGRTGRSYAIPTKDETVRNTRKLTDIQASVAQFVVYTWENPDLRFFVTRVGCGLASIPNDTMAAMFYEAKNCSFPEPWKPFLETFKS